MSYKIGDRVRITSVDKRDAFFGQREKLIGMAAEIVGGPDHLTNGMAEGITLRLQTPLKRFGAEIYFCCLGIAPLYTEQELQEWEAYDLGDEDHALQDR